MDDFTTFLREHTEGLSLGHLSRLLTYRGRDDGSSEACGGVHDAGPELSGRGREGLHVLDVLVSDPGGEPVEVLKELKGWM